MKNTCSLGYELIKKTRHVDDIMDSLSEVDKIKQYFPSGSGPDCSLVIGRQNPHRAWSGLKKADFSTSGLIWTDNGLYEDPVKGNFFLF